jgi:hypothetical protein
VISVERLEGKSPNECPNFADEFIDRPSRTQTRTRHHSKESKMTTAQKRRACAKKQPAKRHSQFKRPGRAAGQQTRAALTAAAVLLVSFLGPACVAEEKESPGTSKSGPVSFTRDIKPIFDEKCVSCHACYDAPGQLDLRTVKGIVRGAMKIDAYGFRVKPIESTYLWNNPSKTIEEWRERGFFSVTEGGRSSIMGKMLALAHANPVQPNERISDDIDIDITTRENYLPNHFEIDGYVAQFPGRGMPFAVSGLTDKEYDTTMTWLEQGAQFDYVAPETTAKESAQLDKWEQWLNSRDLPSQLVGRYFFEHMYLNVVTFEDRDDANRFLLVRSTTPPGKAPDPVDEPTTVNGPVDGPIYYRFIRPDESAVIKMSHLQFLATDEKLKRYQDIFFEEDWFVEKLPGYTEAERYNPLATFSPIPARARYRFLLAIAWYNRAYSTHASGCYTDKATDALRDVAWDVFESPETSLYVTDPVYRAEVDPLLAMIMNPDNVMDLILGFQNYQQRRAVAVQRAVERTKKSGRRTAMTDIWRGDNPDDLPLTVYFIHADNGYVAPGNGVPSHFPKTVSVQDLTTMEGSVYGSVVNYDQFGNTFDQTSGRAVFGVQRTLSELNFLRFLPREVRQPLFAKWYEGPLTKEVFAEAKISVTPDDTIPTDIKYSTDDPVREFQEKLLEHFGPRVNTKDPINRPEPGDVADADHVTKALRSIVLASRVKMPTWRKFKAFLPEATFLRVDRPGQKPVIYTMTHDRDFASKSFINVIMQHEVPRNAQVSIMKGVYTAYPHFMFRIDESEIEQFASTLIDVDTQDKFTALVERWGIRRSSPDFWPVLNSVTDYLKRTTPRRAGTFDIDRYKNL